MRAARILLALVAGLAAIGAAPAPKCDRGCLIGLAERYMDALAAKAPATLPWAETVRFTENGVPMMVGDALWGSVSAHGDKAVEIADSTSGTVTWVGRVDEHGQPAFYAMRLGVTGGRIAEVETVVRRKEGRPPFGDPATFTFDSGYAARLAPKSRTPRDRIAALVEGYYNGMVGNDGTILTRFAPGCTRTVNGVAVDADRARDCEAQFRLGLFRPVDRVRRRVVAIDEERGVAVAIGFADLSAREQTLATTDGRALPAPTRYPHSLAFVTLFKLADGAIAHVDEVATETVYRMPAPFRE